MKCPNFPLFRYTWAGRDESFCCLEHAFQIQGAAEAMGYHLQLIQLSGAEQTGLLANGTTCQSEVPEMDGSK